MSLRSIVKKVLFYRMRTRFVPVPQTVYENRKLEGKNVLITGGGSGIGLSIAQKCIENGASVVITGRTEAKLKAAVESMGPMAHYLVMDVRDVASFDEKIAEACSHFGQRPVIDVLVNNAGIAGGTFDNVTEERYDAIMDTNVKAVFFLSRAVGRHMIANKISGHILNVSSAGALKPASDPYYFSKWAVRGMTLGLADKLLDKGIVVNAIGPGPTLTPIMGSLPPKDDLGLGGRMRRALPEEIADLAIFMISNHGDNIIGDTFYISGGSGTVSLHGE